MSAPLLLSSELDVFMPSDSSVVESTTAGIFDSAFSRCAIKLPNNTTYAIADQASTGTDLWLHAAIYGQSKTGTNSLQTIIGWHDSSDQPWVRLLREPTLDLMSLEYWNGSAWVQIGSTLSVQNNVVQHVDLHVKVNSASGQADLYIAGTQRIASGAINFSGASNLSRVKLLGWGGASNASFSAVSEVLVHASSTIGRRVGTVVMTGNGASTAWTGDYTMIDEIVHDDADTIYSGTASQVELYTGTPVPSFTGYRIVGLGISRRSRKAGSAPVSERAVLRSSGSNYTGSTKSPGFGYTGEFEAWETNPATSAAFLSSEISALQYGLESIT